MTDRKRVLIRLLIWTALFVAYMALLRYGVNPEWAELGMCALAKGIGERWFPYQRQAPILVVFPWEKRRWQGLGQPCIATIAPQDAVEIQLGTDGAEVTKG